MRALCPRDKRSRRSGHVAEPAGADFAVLLSFLTTLLFGLSPTFLAVKKDLRTSLQSAGVNASGSPTGRASAQG